MLIEWMVQENKVILKKSSGKSTKMTTQKQMVEL